MFLSLEQEIRNTLMRMELDAMEGGASTDDMERLSTLLKRWTNLCQGGWRLRQDIGLEEDACFALSGKG